MMPRLFLLVLHIIVALHRAILNKTGNSVCGTENIIPLSSQFALYSLGKKIGQGFPGGLDGKESACNAGDLGSIPVSGKSPGKGNVNPLQYSSLKNPMDRGAWWAEVHEVSQSQTRLSD